MLKVPNNARRPGLHMKTCGVILVVIIVITVLPYSSVFVAWILGDISHVFPMIAMIDVPCLIMVVNRSSKTVQVDKLITMCSSS